MAKKEQSVTVNGKKYNLSALSDSARAQVVSLQYVDRQIIEAKNQVAVLQAARSHYLEQLAKDLPTE